MAGDNVSMLSAIADPSTSPTDPFYFGRLDGARIDLISADPRLDVMFGAEGMLTMNGQLDDDGPFDAFLAMKIDGNFVTASFHKGMAKEDFFEELARCLPPGFEALPYSGGQPELLMLDLVRTPSRGGSPEVSFTCTDPSQRIRWAGKNKFVIEGRAARSLSIRSSLEIELEGRKVSVGLASGDHP